MSEPIKVGDLVVVIKPGCSDCNVGLVFMVDHLRSLQVTCRWCGTFHGDSIGTILYCEYGDTGGFPAERLKRIPPLSELEGEKREENLKEPA